MNTNRTAADHEVTFEDVARAIAAAEREPRRRETKAERIRREEQEARSEAWLSQDPFAIFGL